MAMYYFPVTIVLLSLLSVHATHTVQIHFLLNTLTLFHSQTQTQKQSQIHKQYHAFSIFY